MDQHLDRRTARLAPDRGPSPTQLPGGRPQTDDRRARGQIAEQRLHNQCITRAGCRQPADVVTWLGAVQAQEYPAARSALAAWGRALDHRVARWVETGMVES